MPHAMSALNNAALLDDDEWALDWPETEKVDFETEKLKIEGEEQGDARTI